MNGVPAKALTVICAAFPTALTFTLMPMSRGIFASLPVLLIACSGLALLISRTSVAGPLFYVDFGGGYVQMRNSASFFNGSSNSGSGYGLNLGGFTTFTTENPVLNFQLGIQDRYETTSHSGITDGLDLPYVVARLQLSRMFFGFGYCPYVFQSIGGASAQSATLSHASGAYALLGEVGFLMPVTPRFSFYVSGAYETISQGGTQSPSPIYSGIFGMRFYFDLGEGGEGSNEFHGWRYPFGHELQ